MPCDIPRLSRKNAHHLFHKDPPSERIRFPSVWTLLEYLLHLAELTGTFVVDATGDFLNSVLPVKREEYKDDLTKRHKLESPSRLPVKEEPTRFALPGVKGESSLPLSKISQSHGGG